MNFYYNERCLVEENDDISKYLIQIKTINELLNKNGYKLYLKGNLDIDYKSPHIRKCATALLILKNISTINTDELELLGEQDILPKVDNYYFIELLSLCCKYKNNLIVSPANERVITNEIYNIDRLNLKIKNIIGEPNLRHYLLHNPAPQSISEVFEKASSYNRHIKFTKKSYLTAANRESIYKQFGFNRLLEIFKVMEELLYPYLKGNLTGYNQNKIELEFKRRTNGVEFSNDSPMTMKKYGEERTVHINGTKYTMSFHIKPTRDTRIYFIYSNDDDCIYIGHCGGHLHTIKYN